MHFKQLFPWVASTSGLNSHLGPSKTHPFIQSLLNRSRTQSNRKFSRKVGVVVLLAVYHVVVHPVEIWSRSWVAGGLKERGNPRHRGLLLSLNLNRAGS